MVVCRVCTTVVLVPSCCLFACRCGLFLARFCQELCLFRVCGVLRLLFSGLSCLCRVFSWAIDCRRLCVG